MIDFLQKSDAGDQFSEKSDGDLCHHIMNLLRNNIINLCKAEIKISNNNLAADKSDR